MTCVDQFLDSLPQGLDTRIGRDGIGLSKDQLQRILLARALVRKPAWLFLDEPTSALDATMERQVMENIKLLRRNLGMVVIAHRLSTISDASQILVLHEGRIVEAGSHDKLMDRRNYYFNLVRHQISGPGMSSYDREKVPQNGRAIRL